MAYPRAYSESVLKPPFKQCDEFQKVIGIYFVPNFVPPISFHPPAGNAGMARVL
jgi:hypothetical protein